MRNALEMFSDDALDDEDRDCRQALSSALSSCDGPADEAALPPRHCTVVPAIRARVIGIR